MLPRNPNEKLGQYIGMFLLITVCVIILVSAIKLLLWIVGL